MTATGAWGDAAGVDGALPLDVERLSPALSAEWLEQHGVLPLRVEDLVLQRAASGAYLGVDIPPCTPLALGLNFAEDLAKATT